MDTIYWHMNATQGGANLHPGVNLHLGANLHPGANCAYEHGFRVHINPFVTNGLSYLYHLDESIFIFRDIRSFNFSQFLFHFSMKIFSANRIAPDGTPCFSASHLGLFCLPMSHIKDARRILVKYKN